MGEKKTLYQLMTDKRFIAFNDYLMDKEKDFEDVIQDETTFNMLITEYAHNIQWYLVDWYEAYKDAD